MYTIISFIWGWIKYSLFSKRVELTALVHNNCEIDKYAKVYRRSRLNNVYVGAYSYVGRGCIIHGTKIGKFCSISDYCVIGLPSHSIESISTSPIFSFPRNATGYSWVTEKMEGLTKINVNIGHDVWVGYKAMIVNNVTIGNGAVIAAGAVVTKDVPDYAIVGGVPASVIRYRFDDAIKDTLLKLKWWDWSEERIKQQINQFQKRIISNEMLQSL